MITARRVLALVLKEFLALLKDPRSRSVIIAPPIIQTIVFGYAATYDLKDVPYAVYDEDRSEASTELLAALEGSGSFRLQRTIAREEEIHELIDARKVLVVVRLGPDFERDLERGRAEAQVILDGRNSNTATIALNYIRTIAGRFNEKWTRRKGLEAAPAVLLTRAWFNRNLESRWFIVPGIIGVLTLVVTMLVTALSVARERENGTFDQLLVTPYRPIEILVGKSLPGFLIGLGEASFIIAVAVFWFGVPLRGSLPTLYTGIVLFLISAVGVGLMISSLSVTMQQGLLGAFIFLVPAVILSGFATPIENMPEFVQRITLANPLRYLMVILRRVFLEGTPARLLVSQFWPMAIIGVTTLGLAGWLFRRRLY